MNIIALSSSVSSLSVIVTVVANVASATEILPVPSNDVPPMVLAVARAVAVSALPVTSPVISPTKAVDVIEVAPVTTPASTLIVPSNKIADPAAGSILIAAPESKVNTPAESMSTVPSAVI